MNLKRWGIFLRPLWKPFLVTILYILVHLLGDYTTKKDGALHRRNQYAELNKDTLHSNSHGSVEVEKDEAKKQVITREVTDTWWEKIQRRKQHIKDVCDKYNFSRIDLTSSSLNIGVGSLLVEEKSKLLFCKVPKIANTNWKRVLLGLAGILTNEDFAKMKAKTIHYELIPKYVKSLHLYTLPEREHIFKHFTKVMFLRNPLERLLSVYRNKIENKPYEHPEILSVVGNYIMVHYQGKSPGFPVKIKRTKDTIQGRMPSGETFEADFRHIPDLFPDVKITFEDFLRFIIDNPGRFNTHWAPPHEICLPCAIEYDVIGDFGTLAEDAENILRRLKAKPELKFPSEEQGKISTASLMGKYYRNIPNETLMKVKKRYAVDLDMTMI